jgi:two-component system CheB/CheR fusion protein
VIAANKFFYQKFHVSPRETKKKLIYNLGKGQWDIPGLRKLLEKILPRKTYFRNFYVEHSFPKIGKKVMLLNGRQIYEKMGIFKNISNPLILLVIEDITSLRELQKKATLAKKQ